MPPPLLRIVAAAADLLGWLGWRAPVRSAAMRTLETGVTGGSRTMAGRGRQGDALPRRGSRIAARDGAGTPVRPALPLIPLDVASLSALWIESGLIGFSQREAAEAVLTDRGVTPDLSSLFVLGGSVVDCAVGLALLWRPWARRAALAASAIAIGYMAGGTVFAPDLWSDPLGPTVKVLAVVTLGLVAAALVEDR